MILVIKNGVVVDVDNINYDDTYEVVQWEGELPAVNFSGTPETGLLEPSPVIADPRTTEQKRKDAAEQYLRLRRLAYPKEILQLLHDDFKNGTETFIQAIDEINLLYPKS